MVEMIYYEDSKFLFWEMFNEHNGTLIRSNVIGTKEDPFMRSFPELIDVGIMGHCDAGKRGFCKAVGVDCYQKGASSKKNNMRLDDYKRIIDEAKGKTFQIALGGAGDPNKHDDFEEILKYTRSNGIIPNMTTSGIDISSKEISLIAEYCGAVAVSYYSKLVDGKEINDATLKAIKQLQSCIQTNIHYVVSSDSIDEAIFRLENDVWPEGINAVVFLLYKPVGYGVDKKIIKTDDRLKLFMNAALRKKHFYKIGFDTCFTPILLDYQTVFDIQSIDSCEAARFSMYIDSELNAYPCSFDNQRGDYKVSLQERSIQEVWDSNTFDRFRNKLLACKNCSVYSVCNGGCRLELGINAGINCKEYLRNAFNKRQGLGI